MKINLILICSYNTDVTSNAGNWLLKMREIKSTLYNTPI